MMRIRMVVAQGEAGPASPQWSLHRVAPTLEIGVVLCRLAAAVDQAVGHGTDVVVVDGSLPFVTQGQFVRQLVDAGCAVPVVTGWDAG